MTLDQEHAIDLMRIAAKAYRRARKYRVRGMQSDHAGYRREQWRRSADAAAFAALCSAHARQLLGIE